MAEYAVSHVLQARTALAKATQDLIDARGELVAQTQQLNRLMGRDPEARLRVRSEPEMAPGSPLRAGAAAARGE